MIPPLGISTSKCFLLQINGELCKKLTISWPIISASNPQTNGLDERSNDTLKQRLIKLREDHQDDWECFLDDVASSMRTQIDVTTKFSPYFLMFGRPARSPYEVHLNIFFCHFPIWGRHIEFSFSMVSVLYFFSLYSFLLHVFSYNIMPSQFWSPFLSLSTNLPLPISSVLIFSILFNILISVRLSFFQDFSVPRSHFHTLQQV